MSESLKVVAGEREDLQAISRMDDGVDLLHGQIVTYLGKISHYSFTEAQTVDFLKLMETTNDLESIGDIIETNLVMPGNERIDQQVKVSEPNRLPVYTVEMDILQNLRRI